MSKSLIPDEIIEKKIFFIRDQKVMFDRDLAELYGVETRRLNEQVKRNIERFPDDFMFQLSDTELENWRSHFATSNPNMKMGMRKKPYVFSEHGALMLANVLKSKRAVQISIQIIRVFNKMRELIQDNSLILKKLEELEKRQDIDSKTLWTAIEHLRKKVGEMKYGK